MYKEIIGVKNCYGCGVCSAVCPVDIIRFGPDSDGFYRPSVTDGNKCIDCGLCSGSCSVLSQASATGNRVVEVFAGWSEDDGTRFSTSSGGVGYELAKACVEGGGIFCGARYNAAGRRTEHYISRTTAEAEQSKGSKYMQSDSAAGLREALAQKGHTTITGTPCQIASVRNYLNMRGGGDNFLLVDFFCFGVPSLNLWKKYVADRENTLGRADRVAFRDKAAGWHDSWRIRGLRDGETVYLSEREDLYYKFFLRRYVQSQPCYTCPFRGDNSAADIRLADMWGDKYAANEEGVSVVVAMTEKGLAALRGLNNVTLRSEMLEIAIEGQQHKDQPVPSLRGRLLKELTGSLTLKQIDKKYRARLYLWRLGFRIKRRLCRTEKK